jgi:DNA invertase Pin-like site-specific DNA recombinase
MLEDVRAGKISVVIVKDQSRIGRDVVEVGLLKRTFDEHNVRFIAAADNLDTANGFDMMSIIRDVFNEFFVADTSRKIKAVFKSRMEKGLSCSGSISYGYLADPADDTKQRWIIDEEAAIIVRRIYQMVIDGMGGYCDCKTTSRRANPDSVGTLEEKRLCVSFTQVHRPLRLDSDNSKLYPLKARIHGA